MGRLFKMLALIALLVTAIEFGSALSDGFHFGGCSPWVEERETTVLGIQMCRAVTEAERSQQAEAELSQQAEAKHREEAVRRVNREREAEALRLEHAQRRANEAEHLKEQAAIEKRSKQEALESEGR